MRPAERRIFIAIDFCYTTCMSKNIVLLGGGFGGLRVALELARKMQTSRDYKIILVDRNTHHLYTPLLYEVASAFLQKVTQTETFCMHQGVCTDFSFLQRVTALRSIGFIHGEVTKINTVKQEVHLGKTKISYAFLVVALGAVTEDFGIRDIQKYGHFFKTMADATVIHTRVNELLLQHCQGQEKTVTIVIGGGGPTGVEFAAEISSFCMRACAKYNLHFNNFKVTVIEAGSRLLGVSHPRVSAWAKERLLHLGVDVWLDTCVKEVKKGSVVIAPRPLREGENVDALLCDFRGERDKKFEADIFIWSGGIRAPEVLQKSDLLLDAKGRVDVHETLLAKGKENVFALGDCAALLDPKTKRTVPALGQAAIAQASVVAENIFRLIAGKHLHAYGFPSFPQLIPAGGKYAFGDFGSWYFRGISMWVLRRFADLRYFLSILPFRYAVQTWWNGWRMYTKND